MPTAVHGLFFVIWCLGAVTTLTLMGYQGTGCQG